MLHFLDTNLGALISLVTCGALLWAGLHKHHVSSKLFQHMASPAYRSTMGFLMLIKFEQSSQVFLQNIFANLCICPPPPPPGQDMERLCCWGSCPEIPSPKSQTIGGKTPGCGSYFAGVLSDFRFPTTRANRLGLLAFAC